MAGMFRVRALVPTSSRAFPCVPFAPSPPPTALSPPRSYDLAPHHITLLATRQGARKFNEPLNFDLSSIASMEDMFKVRAFAPTSSRALTCLRSAPAPVPCLEPPAGARHSPGC